MSDQPPPAKSKKTALIAGSIVGVGVLACGLGGVLLAAGGAAWWYFSQPQKLSFEPATWTVLDATSRPVPTPLLHRRMGQPAAPTTPITWTVEPAELGTADAGVFRPDKPGAGTITACTEGVCGTLAVTVQLADAIMLDPPSVELRVWGPKTLRPVATFLREEVTVPLTWRSSDPTVVTVDETGKVTPVGPGTAEIVVSGGGATVSAPFRVYPEPPAGCTLATYADTVGRKGNRTEDKRCQPDAPDFCEWSASQAIADAGRIDEGGGWEWGWTRLYLPANDLDQVWAVAQRCLELPPEIAALPVPTMLKERGTGTTTVPLAGAWDTSPAEAMVKLERGALTVELPSACYATREIAIEGTWIRLGISEGC